MYMSGNHSRVLQVGLYATGPPTPEAAQHHILDVLKFNIQDPRLYNQVAMVICQMLQPNARLRASVSRVLRGLISAIML